MDETSTKKLRTLATVEETGLPRMGRMSTPKTDVEKSDDESHSDSVLEKEGAASGTDSSSSEDLMYFDESLGASKKKTESRGSLFGRTAKLPPRAPVCPGDADVEGVLPSQPSIIRRMQETNKHYVDPKDARTLLPSVLFNSRSLDLDGVLNGMETQSVPRVDDKLQEELLSFIRQKELENLLLAEQQRQQQELLLAASVSPSLDIDFLTTALGQCRMGPPGFPQPLNQESQQNRLLLQQQQPVFNRPRHGRSVSDPTFAFASALNSMPSFPGTPSLDNTATTPMMDQGDALAFLNLSSLSQQQDWSPQDLQPNLNGLYPMANATPQEMAKLDAPPQRRRKHGPSKSVDFHNKNRPGTSKDRNLPVVAPSGKSTTRAEVKKMVQQQAALGRPTFAPWFRDRNRNKDSDQELPPPPAHRRSVSLPQVDTIITTTPPEKQEQNQQPSPKPNRAGTGVFFPRMPVSN